MAMKCSDLGHLASAKSVHLQWVRLLEEEVRMVSFLCPSFAAEAVLTLADEKSRSIEPPLSPSRLRAQMFRQGDMEKEKGYPVSPLMDRAKTGITKSQPGVSGA